KSAKKMRRPNPRELRSRRHRFRKKSGATIRARAAAAKNTRNVTERKMGVGVASSKPSLLRQLGVVSATALVVSNMIGTGIFTTTGFLAGDLGSPSLVIWIWVVGAACALFGAFCYSELGVNMPSS